MLFFSQLYYCGRLLSSLPTSTFATMVHAPHSSKWDPVQSRIISHQASAHGSHLTQGKSQSPYHGLCDLALPPFWPHLPPLSSCLLCSTHSDLLALPQTLHVRPHLRAFALAVPSAWTSLPPDTHMAHSLTFFRSLLR